SAASRSRAPSSTTPASCCSTNPRRASTRRRATSCGTGCSGSRSRARHCCSRRTTWTRPNSCAAASSWSTTGGSWPRAARRPSSAPTRRVRCSRCVSARIATRMPPLRWQGSATVSRCSPTACSSTPTTARPRSPRSWRAGYSPSRVWCGGRASKTSSCGSPGGASSNERGDRMSQTRTTTDFAAEARAAGVRARRFGALYSAEHHVRVWRRYLGVNVASAVGTPVMYLFAFGVGLGVLVNANAGPGGVDGVSYLVFIAPALIATAAVTIASDEFTYPVMQGFKWNPIYVGMHAAPISARQVVDGVIIFVAVRIFATTLVYFLVMAAFGAVPLATGLLTVPIATLTGIAFGAPLFAYAAAQREDRGQFAVVQRVLV